MRTGHFLSRLTSDDPAEGWVRLLGGHITVQCKRRLRAKYLFIDSVAQTLCGPLHAWNASALLAYPEMSGIWHVVYDRKPRV